MKRISKYPTTIPQSLLSGLVFCTLISCLLSSGCKPAEARKRTYREVIVTRPVVKTPATPSSTLPDGHPAINQGMDASALPPSMQSGAGVELAWKAPAGWVETPGKGMRRVSFSPQGSDVLCTIVALSGSAGGMESNLSRWLGQVELKLPHDQLHELAANLETGTTTSGLSISWVDFNPLVSGQDKPSVKAAILEKDGSTVFVKMTGIASALTAQDGAFKTLVGSVE